MENSNIDLALLDLPVNYENEGNQKMDFIRRKKIRSLANKKIPNVENNFNEVKKNGKWGSEEHKNFLEICLKYGTNWPKIQEILQTRSCAQIRSHAQKFVIKLCKKYQIKIKSKKFKDRNCKHLNFIYKKKIVNPKPIDPDDQKFLDLFNYYKREHQIFKIEKIHKNHDVANCPFIVNNLKIKVIPNKNPIWKIQKASHDESNLLLISCESIVNSNQSYNAFIDYKKSNLNFDYNYINSQYLHNYNINNNSDFVELLNSTPNSPFNSTNVSINNKNNINYSFNSKRNYFQDSNENSNDFSLDKLNVNNGFKINSNFSNDIRTNTRDVTNNLDSTNIRKSIFNKSETNYDNQLNLIKNQDPINLRKFNQGIKENKSQINKKELNRANISINGFLRDNLTYLKQQLHIIKTFNERSIACLKNSNIFLDFNKIEDFEYEDINYEIRDFTYKIQKYFDVKPCSK